jgi:transcriptional regulator with XRE-family HTH domain
MSNILHSQAGPPDDVLAHVARNLRELRAAAGLSQQQVADRSGLSRRMVVALEGGDTNISLAKLSRVAAALNVGFARIVHGPESGGREPGRATVWRGRLPGSHAELLGAAPCAEEVEFWAWSIAAGERYQAEPDPPGYREAIYVIEGELTLELAETQQAVPAGALTVFPSDQIYAYANRGAGPLRFLRSVLG